MYLILSKHRFPLAVSMFTATKLNILLLLVLHEERLMSEVETFLDL